MAYYQWSSWDRFLPIVICTRKLIVLSVSKKKQERAYTRNLTVHLKVLEQKEANIPKRSRQ